MNVLEIENLSKAYGKVKALDNLNLTLEAGNVYGLLGPNGSGKTTTLGILLNVLFPSSGSFTWFENQYKGNHRRHIGAILETPNFYPYMDADQNLKVVQQIKNSFRDDISELLEIVNLKDRRDSKFRTYSLGMKQRLAIAASMIGDPQLLIFDEPTNGLDPQGIAEIRNIIKRIAATGKTIFMASHILDEVEKICSHVAILKKGKLLAEGPVGAILESDNLIEIQLGEGSMTDFLSLLNQHPSVHQVDEKDKFYLLSVDDHLSAAEINRFFYDKGLVLSHLKERKRTLEEEFLTITQ